MQIGAILTPPKKGLTPRYIEVRKSQKMKDLPFKIVIFGARCAFQIGPGTPFLGFVFYLCQGGAGSIFARVKEAQDGRESTKSRKVG